MQLPVIHTIDDILEPHEPAVVFFTRGDQFDPVNGYTGAWILAPENLVPGMKVVVYLRANHQNSIYTSHALDFVGPFDGPHHHHRYGINLANVHLEGITNNNWYAFAHTGPNPVRFFNP